MTYNSPSGHTTLIGGLTKLVLAYKFYSKLCYTCDRYASNNKNATDLVPPPEHRCAKNWTESSKAMEAHGIVDCATQIFDLGPGYMHTFVSNDDSSSRAALHHPLDFKKASGVFIDWPRDKNKRLVKNTGKLPPRVPEPEIFLVDPLHHQHIYGKHLYNLGKNAIT